MFLSQYERLWVLLYLFPGTLFKIITHKCSNVNIGECTRESDY